MSKSADEKDKEKVDKMITFQNMINNILTVHNANSNEKINVDGGLKAWLELGHDGLYSDPMFVEYGDGNLKNGWLENLVFGNSEEKKAQLLLLKKGFEDKLKEVSNEIFNMDTDFNVNF